MEEGKPKNDQAMEDDPALSSPVGKSGAGASPMKHTRSGRRREILSLGAGARSSPSRRKLVRATDADADADAGQPPPATVSRTVSAPSAKGEEHIREQIKRARLVMSTGRSASSGVSSSSSAFDFDALASSSSSRMESASSAALRMCDELEYVLSGLSSKSRVVPRKKRSPLDDGGDGEDDDDLSDPMDDMEESAPKPPRASPALLPRVRRANLVALARFLTKREHRAAARARGMLSHVFTVVREVFVDLGDEPIVRFAIAVIFFHVTRDAANVSHLTRDCLITLFEIWSPSSAFELTSELVTIDSISSSDTPSSSSSDGKENTQTQASCSSSIIGISRSARGRSSNGADADDLATPKGGGGSTAASSRSAGGGFRSSRRKRRKRQRNNTLNSFDGLLDNVTSIVPADFLPDASPTNTKIEASKVTPAYLIAHTVRVAARCVPVRERFLVDEVFDRCSTMLVDDFEPLKQGSQDAIVRVLSTLEVLEHITADKKVTLSSHGALISSCFRYLADVSYAHFFYRFERLSNANGSEDSSADDEGKHCYLQLMLGALRTLLNLTNIESKDVSRSHVESVFKLFALCTRANKLSREIPSLTTKTKEANPQSSGHVPPWCDSNVCTLSLGLLINCVEKSVANREHVGRVALPFHSKEGGETSISFLVGRFAEFSGTTLRGDCVPTSEEEMLQRAVFAAYLALVLGCLANEVPQNARAIGALLPSNGSAADTSSSPEKKNEKKSTFSPLIDTLKKFIHMQASAGVLHKDSLHSMLSVIRALQNADKSLQVETGAASDVEMRS